MHAALLLACLALCARPAWPAGQEEETARFLAAFFGQTPASQTLWLTGELKSELHAALGHDYPAARLRYWRVGPRSAWVLEEIGKEMPITVGIGVDGDALARVRVLAYRESRGWEVKSPAFTAQFDGARLGMEGKLDRSIAGIAGATLSVRALTKLTRAALLLHRRIQTGATP